MLVSSTYLAGPVQEDGRQVIIERHTEADGRMFAYEYLWDGAIPVQSILEERAASINATLAARAAAMAAVAGTSTPLTRYEFLSRFTTAERVGIRDAAKTNPIIEDFMKMMELSGTVVLALARPGLTYLVSVDKLTAERAAVIGAD